MHTRIFDGSSLKSRYRKHHPFLGASGHHLSVQDLDCLTLDFTLLMLAFDEYKEVGAQRGNRTATSIT